LGGEEEKPKTSDFLNTIFPIIFTILISLQAKQVEAKPIQSHQTERHQTENITYQDTLQQLLETINNFVLFLQYLTQFEEYRDIGLDLGNINTSLVPLVRRIEEYPNMTNKDLSTLLYQFYIELKNLNLPSLKQKLRKNGDLYNSNIATQGGETHRVHSLLEINKLIRYLHDLENILENARNTNK